MQKRSLCHFLSKRADSLFTLLSKGRANALMLILAAFLLQSCSYSSPNAGDNILGKTARQTTSSKTPRRAPVGNLDSSSDNAVSPTSSKSSAKKANPDYDAYQHYQAGNLPKKAKRRPLLNLNELNGIMDNEAAAIDAAHSATAPSIDAESDLNQVIAHNKAKKKTQKKKKAKLLVIKKTRATSESAESCANPPVSAPAAVKTPVAKKSPVNTAISAQSPVVTSAPKTKPVASSVKTPVTKPLSKTPVTPDNNTSAKYASVPIVEPQVANTVNLPVTAVASQPVPVVEPLKSSPVNAAPIVNNAPATAPLLPQETLPPVPAPPAPPLDIKNMSQQDIEAAVKSKFNNTQGGGLLDKAISNSDKTAVQPKPAPANNIPLPTLPASMSNITESSISSRLSNLNDLLIKYYFSIKSFLLSYFSFAD